VDEEERSTSSGAWVWVLAGVVPFSRFVCGNVIFERRGLGGLSLAAQMYVRLLRFPVGCHVRWRDSYTPHERGLEFASAVPEASRLILQSQTTIRANSTA